MRAWHNYRVASARGQIYVGDALEFLRSRRPETADIVFLDPPFNLGKVYGRRRDIDKQSDDVYELWIESILTQSIRILKPGASLYLYHLPKWALVFGSYLSSQLLFRHWIAVSMKNGFVRRQTLYPAHYALLHFTKGVPGYFVRPKQDPESCRHCGKFIKDYGGYKDIIIAQGINLSDVWTDLSPVRHRSTKTRRANELPVEMVRRIVAMSGEPNALFVDPFAGSGAGVVAAVQGGLRFAACDILEENAKVTKSRVEKWLSSDPKERKNGISR